MAPENKIGRRIEYVLPDGRVLVTRVDSKGRVIQTKRPKNEGSK